eukprot:5500344-Prymnesium_polylepis.1
MGPPKVRLETRRICTSIHHGHARAPEGRGQGREGLYREEGERDEHANLTSQQTQIVFACDVRRAVGRGSAQAASDL